MNVPLTEELLGFADVTGSQVDGGVGVQVPVGVGGGAVEGEGGDVANGPGKETLRKRRGSLDMSKAMPQEAAADSKAQPDVAKTRPKKMLGVGGTFIKSFRNVRRQSAHEISPTDLKTGDKTPQPPGSDPLPTRRLAGEAGGAGEVTQSIPGVNPDVHTSLVFTSSVVRPTSSMLSLIGIEYDKGGSWTEIKDYKPRTTGEGRKGAKESESAGTTDHRHVSADTEEWQRINKVMLSHAVQSIPAYIERSSLIIVLVPPCKHADREEICDQVWCVVWGGEETGGWGGSYMWGYEHGGGNEWGEGAYLGTWVGIRGRT